MGRSPSRRRKRKAIQASVSPASSTSSSTRRVRAKLEKGARRSLLKEASSEYLQSQSKTGRAAYGLGNKLLQKYKKIAEQQHGESEFVTLKKIQYGAEVLKKTLLHHPSSLSSPPPVSEILISSTETSITSSVSAPPDAASPLSSCDYSRKKGSRPEGTRKAAAKADKTKLESATRMAAERFLAERQKVRESKKPSVPNGTLEKIVSGAEKEFDLPVGLISRDTVRTRADRRNPSGQFDGRVSPLIDIEPTIVEHCVRLARMGQPPDRDQVVSFANDLIAETEHESKLSSWKKRFLHSSNTENVLGAGWYRGFMRRHGGKLKSKCQSKDAS